MNVDELRNLPAGICLSSDHWDMLKSQFGVQLACSTPRLQNIFLENNSPTFALFFKERNALCRIVKNVLEHSSDADWFSVIQANLGEAGISNDIICSNPCPSMKYLENSSISRQSRLARVQNYISQLGYNHMLQLFSVNKHASMRSLSNLAQSIIEAGYPIKCLEAVVVSTYLTHRVSNIVRLTLSFKTVCNNKVYRHIVLAVGIQSGKEKRDKKFIWGSIGLSRRAFLGNKPFEFASLSSLIDTYRDGYHKVHHHVVRIKVSESIPNDEFSFQPFNWACMSCHFKSDLWVALCNSYESKLL